MLRFNKVNVLSDVIYRQFNGVTHSGNDQRNRKSSSFEAHEFAQIPCVPTLPILGSTWTTLPFVGRYDKTRYHERAYQLSREYGKLVREKFGNVNVVWVFDANDAETVYRNEGKCPHRVGLGPLTLYRKIKSQYKNSGGLLTTQGETWWNCRSKSQSHLLKTSVVNSHIAVTNSIANEMINKIDHISSLNNGHVDNFTHEMYRYALESISAVVTGKRIGALNSNLSSSVNNAEQLIESMTESAHYETLLEFQVIALWRLIRRPFGIMWQRYSKAYQKSEDLILHYLSNSKKAFTPSECLQNKSVYDLLRCTPEFDDNHATLTSLDLILSGVDTTSHTLVYTLYFLARNEQIQKKAREEVNAVVGDARSITVEFIAELKYLTACIKEAQRLLRIVPIVSRVLKKEVILSGYRVPPKTIISVCHYAMCRNEEYFSEPLAYKPERWIKSKHFGGKRVYGEHIHPFAALQFGYGLRMCIGRRFAKQELLILLSKMLKMYEIEFDGDDLNIVTGPATKPDKPVTFKLKRV